MKKMYLILTLIGILAFSFTSCEKDETLPPSKQQTTVPTDNNTIKTHWVLDDGTVIDLVIITVGISGPMDDWMDLSFYYDDGDSLIFQDIHSHTFKWTFEDEDVYIDSITFPNDEAFLNKFNNVIVEVEVDGYAHLNLEQWLYITTNEGVSEEPIFYRAPKFSFYVSKPSQVKIRQIDLNQFNTLDELYQWMGEIKQTMTWYEVSYID